MRSLSTVGLGLSLVFGCLLLALLAELYYLLWWKKRITTRGIQDDFSSPEREFFYMFCWKKPTSLSSTALQTDTRVHEPQAQNSKDLWFKPYGGEEDSVETELLRLQNLSRPPRFLFTIKEETKEDLESEDKSKRGSRGRSLSDIVLNVETPFLTPLASPPFFTPPLTPMKNGFNPMFKSPCDAEFNRIRSSPPPMFKFLRDAEDKLHRRKLMEDVELGGSVVQDDDDDGFKVPSSSKCLQEEEENGSFITLIVGNNKEREFSQQQHNIPQYPSSSSQVLPLAGSPPTFRSQSKNPISRGGQHSLSDCK